MISLKKKLDAQLIRVMVLNLSNELAMRLIKSGHCLGAFFPVEMAKNEDMKDSNFFCHQQLHRNDFRSSHWMLYLR